MFTADTPMRPRTNVTRPNTLHLEPRIISTKPSSSVLEPRVTVADPSLTIVMACRTAYRTTTGMHSAVEHCMMAKVSCDTEGLTSPPPLLDFMSKVPSPPFTSESLTCCTHIGRSGFWQVNERSASELSTKKCYGPGISRGDVTRSASGLWGRGEGSEGSHIGQAVLKKKTTWFFF